MSNTLRQPISFRVADKELEPKLAQFSATNSINSAFALRLERPLGFSPSFEVEGIRRDLLAGLSGDRIIAFASRAERLAYINGSAQSETIGTIGNLRIDPDFRGTLALARGLKKFHELDSAAEARCYLAFVQVENQKMQALLRRKRGLLPDFRDFGNISSFFLLPRRLMKLSKADVELEVRSATPTDLAALSTFHRQVGSGRQFFPQYPLEQLSGSLEQLRGVELSDIVVAIRNGEILGSVVRWSQLSFRRWIVEGYRQPLRSFRPLYNIYANLSGRMSLPGVNRPFPYAFLSLLCVKKNEEQTLRQLLRHVAERHRNEPLVLALHERDPFHSFVKSIAAHRIQSKLFVAECRHRSIRLESPEERVPFIDAGTI